MSNACRNPLCATRGAFLLFTGAALGFLLLLAAKRCDRTPPLAPPPTPSPGEGPYEVSEPSPLAGLSLQDGRLWQAICHVESGGRVLAYNEVEDAAGIAQIRPCVVEDCNRILGAPVFGLADRYDPRASEFMFQVYTGHYAGAGAGREARARVWNGGPLGGENPRTLDYWRKVQAALQEAP